MTCTETRPPSGRQREQGASFESREGAAWLEALFLGRPSLVEWVCPPETCCRSCIDRGQQRLKGEPTLDKARRDTAAAAVSLSEARAAVASCKGACAWLHSHGFKSKGGAVAGAWARFVGEAIRERETKQEAER